MMEKPSREKAWRFFYRFIPMKLVEGEKEDIPKDHPGLVHQFSIRKETTAERQARVDSDAQVDLYPVTHEDDSTTAKVWSSLGHSGHFSNADTLKDAQHLELYPYCSTKLSELAHLGIGVGLYFESLRSFGLLMFVYGLFLLPRMVYFLSTSYDAFDFHFLKLDTYDELVFLGSAECESYKTVNITGCVPTGTPECQGTSTMGRCQLKGFMGLTDLCGVVVVLISFWMHYYYVKKAEVMLDEAVQTPQDYSMVVKDPGPDDDDPDAWCEFFEKNFGKVANITIVRDNNKLLELLTRRREILHAAKIQKYKQHFEEANEHSPLTEPMKADVEAIEEKIQNLIETTGSYPVAKVFVTFDTEESQRKALKALTVGWLPSMFDLSLMPDEYKFVGRSGAKNILDVEEALEPDDINYQNLGLSNLFLTAQTIVTILISLGFVCGIYTFLQLKANSWQTAFYGSFALIMYIIDQALPDFVEFLASFEKHRSKEDLEHQVMLKLTLARFLNTAIINFITTSFSDTLSYDTYQGIQSIFLMEAFLIPIAKLLNVTGFVRRQILARNPTIKTQHELNVHFRPTEFELGSYYTAATTVMFFTLFYSSIFPGGPFYASLYFLFTYFVDKWMLLRKCEKPPKIGASLALSQMHYVLIGVIFHLYVSSYWYYGWPFDTTYEVQPGVYAFAQKNKVANEEYQNFLLPYSESWMPLGQAFVVDTYTWAAIGMLGLLLSYFGVFSVFKSARRLFCGKYEPVGEDQQIPYTEVEEIDAYIPTVLRSPENIGPLIASNLFNVPERYLCEEFEEYDSCNQNVALDIEDLNVRRKLFGICKTYMLPKVKEELIEGAEGESLQIMNTDEQCSPCPIQIITMSSFGERI